VDEKRACQTVTRPTSLRRSAAVPAATVRPGRADAAGELRRMEEAGNARREREKLAGRTEDSHKSFKAVRLHNAQGTLPQQSALFYSGKIRGDGV
jgi:hypothetical protein